MLQLFVKFKVIPSVILFAAGIYSAFFFRTNTTLFILSFILCISLTFILRSRAYTAVPLLFLFFITGNYLQAERINQLSEPFIKQFAANNIKLRGTIHNIEPQSFDTSEYLIRFDYHAAAFEGQDNSKQMLTENPHFSDKNKLTGRIFPASRSIYDSLYNMLRPGASYLVKGDFRNFSGKRNPGDFDFAFFYGNEGYKGSINIEEIKVLTQSDRISVEFEGLILDARNSIKERLFRYFSKETASVLSALITGDKSGLDDEVKENFRKSGVTHVLAVSGLHVGFIILILGALLKRFGRLVYIPGILAGIAVFAFISGFQAPVLRASVMAATFLIAGVTGRSSNGYNNIAIAALIILAVNPAELFKPGFQLSFAAAVSIVWASALINKIEEYIRKEYSAKSVYERTHPDSLLSKLLRSAAFASLISYLIITTAVLIFTLPFIAYYFGQVSLISLVANALVIPLISLLLAEGITVLFFSFVSSWIAYLFAAAGDMLYNITIYFISELSGLENLILDFRQFSLTAALIYSVHLIFLLAVISRGRKIYRVAAIILTAVSFLSWYQYAEDRLPEPGKLSIIMADAGQGDAVIMVTPSGKAVMVDAGALSTFNNAAKRFVIPLTDYLGISKIDLGFISHWDNDHAGGFLYMAERGLIRKILMPKPPAEDDSVANMYLNFLKSKNVETEYASEGFFNFEGLHFTLFNAGDDSFGGERSSNESSLLIKAEYGSTRVLFTGDLPSASEKVVVKKFGEFLRSDILKVSHHGSKTATSELFIDAVQPEYALISAGRGNSFNHPAPEVTGLLMSKGINIQRTDLSGCRILVSDGEKISVKEWR